MEELFKCECSSSEHIIIISIDEEDIDRDMYIHIHLSKISFFKRLIHAFKYIFGYKCKYGDFDEIIIKKSDKERLLNTINKL